MPANARNRATDALTLTATSLEAAPVQPAEVVREVAGVWGATLIAPIDDFFASLRAVLFGADLAPTRLLGQLRSSEELEK